MGELSEIRDARCGTCGRGAIEGANFCFHCGTPVSPSAAKEQRRSVTAVFTDLVGSTTLQERLDVEVVRDLMTRFHAAMRDEFQRHGGYVEKYIGDAVVAVFGARGVREDDAARAVRAAAATRDALSILNEALEREYGVRLAMRVGVSTGDVVTGQDGLVLGDVMNVAARLQQMAGPGDILVTASTYRLVRQHAQLEDVGDLPVKGREAHVRVYRLVAAAPDATRPSIRARFEGRADELRRLRAAWDDVVTSFGCRVVSIVGSPGLGKTRLAHEFASSLSGASVIDARCDASGEGATLLPLTQVLRQAGDLVDVGGSGDVTDRISTLLGDDADVPSIAEAAAGLLGLGPPTGLETVFWALRRIVEAAALRRPLVALLDDAHWGQRTFLDFVEHLAQWVRAPVLVVLIARPEIRDVAERLVRRGGRVADVIELVPLTASQSSAVLRSALDGTDVSPRLSDRIIATAEGNPLYLAEMLRMLVDDGVLRFEDDRWVVTSADVALDVPPTVTALLAARVERLSPVESDVLECAAVIGQTFSRAALLELLERGGDEVDEQLERLARKDLIRPAELVGATARGSSSDTRAHRHHRTDDTFSFHHVLVRDAAYQHTLKRRRAEVHERFADWLHASAGPDQDEAVAAFHLEQAFGYLRELGVLDQHAAAVGMRAGAALDLAGRAALAREDLHAAENLLRRALAIPLVSVAQRVAVLLNLAETLLSRGDAAAASTVLAELREALAVHDDARATALADVLEAERDVLAGSAPVDRSVDRARSAARELERQGDHCGVAKAYDVAAHGLQLLGSIGEAEATLDEALAAARAGRDQRRVAAVLSRAPRVALQGPSPLARAGARCVEVAGLRGVSGARHLQARAMRCRAVIEAMRGGQGARQLLRTSQATFEDLGLGHELLETLVDAGHVELLLGDLEVAEQHLRAAYEALKHVGPVTVEARALALLARVLLEQGRDATALVLALEVETLPVVGLVPRCASMSVRAEVMALRGEYDGAEVLAREAEWLIEQTDALVERADAALALAVVLAAAGREDESASAAERALRLYDAKGHVVGVARAARRSGNATAGASVEGAGALGVEELHRKAMSKRNLSTTTLLRQRLCEALASGDMTGVRRLLGRSAGDLIAAVEQGSTMTELEPVITVEAGFAVRCAVRRRDAVVEQSDPFLIVCLCDEGRLSRSEVVAAGDEQRALGLLAARSPAAVAAQVVFAAAHNVRDVATVGALYSEDYVMVDHRQMGLEEQVGRQVMVDLYLASVELVPDLRAGYHLIEDGDDVVLGRTTFAGIPADGDGRFEMLACEVTRFRDGCNVRSEFYDPEDIESALSRFHAMRQEALR